MAKFTYKEIKQLIKFTPSFLKNKELYDFKNREKVGFYHPSTANWCYEVFAIACDGGVYIVATRFGSII